MNEVKLLWVEEHSHVKFSFIAQQSWEAGQISTLPERMGVLFPNTLTDPAQTSIFARLMGDSGVVMV